MFRYQYSIKCNLYKIIVYIHYMIMKSYILYLLIPQRFIQSRTVLIHFSSSCNKIRYCYLDLMKVVNWCPTPMLKVTLKSSLIITKNVFPLRATPQLAIFKYRKPYDLFLSSRCMIIRVINTDFDFFEFFTEEMFACRCQNAVIQNIIKSIQFVYGWLVSQFFGSLVC